MAVRRLIPFLSPVANHSGVCRSLSSSATPSASQSRYSQAVRLADFILANVEPILVEWESFARSIWPDGATADPAEVRDEAEDILRATAVDMQSEQTAAQQAEKSKGASRPWDERSGLTRASSSHGSRPGGVGLRFVGGRRRIPRSSGKRAPTLAGQRPAPDLRDVDDVTRFNESIDQSLTHAVRSYAEQVDRDREALLAREQASRQEAEAANRAKDVFLATLSHEMRTPLNAIVGWLSILRHEDAETKTFSGRAQGHRAQHQGAGATHR